ncbi:anti-phage defense-associated sirtuin Dsr1 [uncultured Neptuniibacter sp.]|uniref:anti-phage defense-associated sirtuin Dsr1 n=1 Tax=uncultured Neptuniibacter sp. TaxID=502143 RepID=UPI0026139825|nr:anti-phage defense-associated sirtuin Dsr1 [uncultured Neptuniibacter sp.]
MQFIANGPEIPEELLQAHEDGQVIFFCGAGISYPAGLPGFGGLVKKIYEEIGDQPTRVEQEAIAQEKYDAALDLLERRVPGQRISVREALSKVLKPKWRRKGATETHEALLQLARNNDGTIRLVTTNFDRIFERAAKKLKRSFSSLTAPTLPVPKKSRWDGLVYLHGQLPEKENPSALNRLVLTSGDFGLAYLTERWASRFVSELFQNYVVCFVGYSINDPVMRYMMDALAADRMLGEVTPPAYAFGSYYAGEEPDAIIDWEGKGVVPILYEVPTGTHDHSALHNTLKAWAETHRDGVLGKESIVTEYALSKPAASTKKDDYVGRMLWALSDESGLPAKAFADHNPVPSLDWLDAFEDNRFGHHDLIRFGVQPDVNFDKKLSFSIARRPAPYSKSARMSLWREGFGCSDWDKVMHQIARWLVRHLNNPDLILWISKAGGRLNSNLERLVESHLSDIQKLKEPDGNSELKELLDHSPDAVPSPRQEILWDILLTGRIKSTWSSLSLYEWKSRLSRRGLTGPLRSELRELLSPRVKLKKPIRWGEQEADGETSRVKDLLDWDLVLASDYVDSTLLDCKKKYWLDALPLLIMDFQQLLHEALDLLKELGEADSVSDRSYWDMPSISPHSQNRRFSEWVSLIELLRESWLSVCENDEKKAGRVAREWFYIPYPTFKRLALFAASQTSDLEPEEWLGWLLDNNSEWLWSLETQRETMRLIVLQGQKLRKPQQELLEHAILAGPNREPYRADLTDEEWGKIVDRSVWLHVAKLNQSGAVLGAEARREFERLSVENPHWVLSNYQREEFSHWMSGSGDPDFEDQRVVEEVPNRLSALVAWLKKPVKEKQFFYEDTWRVQCSSRFFLCLAALSLIAKDDQWPEKRWREALQAWSDENSKRSWEYASGLISLMPDEQLKGLLHSFTWWLEKASNSVVTHQVRFIDLCQRVLHLDIPSDTGILKNGEPINQPVSEAINHPVGHVVKALINYWFISQPEDNEGLPTDLRPILTEVCVNRSSQYRHGRVILASRLITLYRVDRQWTETHLLPLFDWDNVFSETAAVWEGFLWSPRIYRPLITSFKRHLLKAATHYEKLGEHRSQYAAFLTYLALDPGDLFTLDELKGAIRSLPEDGLEEVAQALLQALQGAGKSKEDYWNNRVSPFWHNLWPKRLALATDEISTNLARLCIAADSEFPQALSTVINWLQPLEHANFVVYALHQSKLCTQYPNDALKLLISIINTDTWVPSELKACLEDIGSSMPSLKEDPLFIRLELYVRNRTL